MTDRTDRINRKPHTGALVAGADLLAAGAAIDQRVILYAVLRAFALVVARIAPLIGAVEAFAAMRTAGRTAFRFQRNDKRMIFGCLAVVSAVPAGIRIADVLLCSCYRLLSRRLGWFFRCGRCRCRRFCCYRWPGRAWLPRGGRCLCRGLSPCGGRRFRSCRCFRGWLCLGGGLLLRGSFCRFLNMDLSRRLWLFALRCFRHARFRNFFRCFPTGGKEHSKGKTEHRHKNETGDAFRWFHIVTSSGSILDCRMDEIRTGMLAVVTVVPPKRIGTYIL